MPPRSSPARLAPAGLLALALLFPPSLRAQQEGGAAPAEEQEEEDLSAVNAPPPAVPPESVPPGTDSVTATPGRTYGAGGLHRFFFGDLRRDLWEIPFTVEVLDLGATGGGLEPDELSGGMQTVGLHFEGGDGLPYQFRSLVKDATRAIPGPLRINPLSSVIQDQMAAQFPLGAMVVAELLETAGVLVATPRIVVMPDDPRLGKYREIFAGRMGWIEERPDEREGDRPGFRGSSKVTGTDVLYERLDEDPRNYVNAERLLRARFIDMLVGDWDRHHDQWRWASFEDGERIRWEPIPRDRDWAFTQIDGFFPGWAGLYYPQYRGFGYDYPPVFNLHWNAQFLDRRLLPPLDREDYERIARELHDLFDDEVLERAVSVLPPGYRDAIGDELLTDLRHRRDRLPELAMEFYELMAPWVDVHTSNADDVATIDVDDAGDVTVRVVVPAAGDLVYYERTFHAAETDEIRLYTHGGDDRIEIRGAGSPIKLRLMGGHDDDVYDDGTSGRNVLVYDDDGDDTFDLGEHGWKDQSEFDTPDELQDIDLVWQARDWGHNWVPMPYLYFDPDTGPYIGASLTRYGFGFRRDPWRSNLTVTAAVGPTLGRTLGEIHWTRTLTNGGLRGGLDLEFRTVANERFFGFGNETVDEGTDFNRSYRSSLDIGLRLESAQDQALRGWAGPVLRFDGKVDEEEGTIFETERPYGSETFHQLGLRGGVLLTNYEQPAYPSTGGEISLEGEWFPAALDVEDPFGGLRAVGRYVLAAGDSILFAPALHVRATGEKVWGDAPFQSLADVGGSASLLGFRSNRFLGQEAVSASALARARVVHLPWLASTDWGVLGIVSTGRVWLDGEESDEWHTGVGGGIWVKPDALGSAVSLSIVEGDGKTRVYLDLGFPF